MAQAIAALIYPMIRSGVTAVEKLRRVGKVFLEAGRLFQKHRGANMAAALAFYAILSAGPILVIVLAISDSVWGREAAGAMLMEKLSEYLGRDAALTLTKAADASRVKGTISIAQVIPFLMLIWSATLFLSQLRSSLATIWNRRMRKGAVRSFFQHRGVALLTLSIVGILILLSTMMFTVVHALRDWVASFAPFLAHNFVVKTVAWTAWFTLLVSVLFKTLAGRTIKTKDIVVGAFVTAFLFTITRSLLVYYLKHSNVASVYGAAGALATISLWAYVSSMAMLYGAAFTRAWKIARIDRRAK